MDESPSQNIQYLRVLVKQIVSGFKPLLIFQMYEMNRFGAFFFLMNINIRWLSLKTLPKVAV